MALCLLTIKRMSRLISNLFQEFLLSTSSKTCRQSCEGWGGLNICNRPFLHSHANKILFHKKASALSLVLKARGFGTRKWPILSAVLQN